MATFESSVKQIACRQTTVYNNLSDLSKLQQLKDHLPADKQDGFSINSDSISIKSPMGSDILLRIIEREAPKTIKFEAANAPVPLNFWIQLLPVTDDSCKIKLTIKADIPFFMKAMAEKPLSEGLEKVAEALAMIPYKDE